MRKSIVIVFFLVLILTIFLVAAYFLSSGKNKTTSYQIYSDVKNTALYPYIARDDITSGKLLDFLKKEDAKGKLVQIPASAEPIFLGSTSPEFFNTNGFAHVQPTSEDLASNK